MRAVLQAFAGYISTHILTRRMTWLRRMPLAALRYFNSHPHKEDDRNGKKVAISKKYFNSHPHKEDDSIQRRRNVEKYISTHILTRRMTSSYPCPNVPTYFNSHPHKEDDSNFKQKQSI